MALQPAFPNGVDLLDDDGYPMHMSDMMSNDLRPVNVREYTPPCVRPPKWDLRDTHQFDLFWTSTIFIF